MYGIEKEKKKVYVLYYKVTSLFSASLPIMCMHLRIVTDLALPY